MEKQFDTSFIPQQPLLNVEGSLRFQRPMNFALVIALVIFFVSLTVFGGLYFFKVSVDRRIVVLEKELESKETSLQIADIKRYKEIDTRINLAKDLLKNHVAFSEILTLVEKITAQDIGWTSLSYKMDEKNGLLNINLVGQAPSYRAVYVQAEKLRAFGQPIRSVDVGMPTLVEGNGVVGFSTMLTVDPDYIKYARVVDAKAAPLHSSENETGQAPQTQTP